MRANQYQSPDDIIIKRHIEMGELAGEDVAKFIKNYIRLFGAQFSDEMAYELIGAFFYHLNEVWHDRRKD